MRLSRIYCSEELAEQQSLLISGEAARYISAVLRLKAGQNMILFNGDGCDYLAEISVFQKKSAEVKILKKISAHRESSLKIHLGQAISRGERMDFAIQKAVELGVHAITPLVTAHCAISYTSEQLLKKQAHWTGIIISACEQSGRNVLPTLWPAVNLSQWLENFSKELEMGLVGDPEADLLLKNHARQKPEKIRLVIGPEGGLHQDEINLLKQQGFVGVNLGPRILRTETATVVMLALAQQQWGDI